MLIDFHNSIILCKRQLKEVQLLPNGFISMYMNEWFEYEDNNGSSVESSAFFVCLSLYILQGCSKRFSCFTLGTLVNPTMNKLEVTFVTSTTSGNKTIKMGIALVIGILSVNTVLKLISLPYSLTIISNLSLKLQLIPTLLNLILKS